MFFRGERVTFVEFAFGRRERDYPLFSIKATVEMVDPFGVAIANAFVSGRESDPEITHLQKD